MYNRQKAIEYAFNFYNKRNPEYYAFDNLGGDCTNFICQCLHAGGIPMNYEKDGWYYINLNNRSTSWSGVNEFYSFAINNRQKGAKAKETELSELMVGDVIQLGNDSKFYHTLIVTKILFPKTFNNVYVAAHDRDAFDRVLNSYVFKKARFLHIFD